MSAPDQEKLHRIAALVIGLLFAIWCGGASGAGQYGMITGIFGAVMAILLCVWLKTNLWILIPFGAALGGQFMFLPGQPSALEIGVILSFCGFLVFKAVKMVRIRPSYNFVDFILLINLLYLLITYIRNPVGILTFETDRIGGRHYFAVVVSLLAYWVLCRATISIRMSKLVAWMTLWLASVGAFLGLLVHFVPGLGVLGGYYSGFATMLQADQTQPRIENVEAGDTRLQYMASFMKQSFPVLAGFFRPLTLLNPLHLGRHLIFVAGMIGILLSGFRSELANIGLMFVVACLYWKRPGDIAKAAMIAVIAFAALVLVHESGYLPGNIQRTVSFLPGKWEGRIVGDATESTKWRVYMWERMMEDSQFFENHWLGDGFGFRKSDVEAFQTAYLQKRPYALQDYYILTGDVHSGPYSSIRFVGYIGLGLFSILLLGAAYKAHKLILASRETPLFPFTMAICLGWVVHPFTFLLVFGAYPTSFSMVIIALGMFKVIERALDAYRAEIPDEAKTDEAPVLNGRSLSAAEA